MVFFALLLKQNKQYITVTRLCRVDGYSRYLASSFEHADVSLMPTHKDMFAPQKYICFKTTVAGIPVDNLLSEPAPIKPTGIASKAGRRTACGLLLSHPHVTGLKYNTVWSTKCDRLQN